MLREPFDYVVIKETVSFSLDSFLKAVDVIIKNPEYSSPPVLRAEILETSTSNDSTTYTIKLLPRQPKRDIEMVHSVIISSNSSDAKVRFIPSGTQLPFYYPIVKEIIYNYKTSLDSLSFELSISVISDLDEPTEKINFIIKKLFASVLQYAKNTDYVKRVNHDTLINKIVFQDEYAILKSKFSKWVQKWPSNGLDPSKHVFEDISIATFISILFPKKSFIDLGTGNGFLVHILSEIGLIGSGIDIWKRDHWELYPKTTKLIESVIHPPTAIYKNINLIIGNHADELTLWIPIIAMKSNSESFVIIPCCFHNLDGSKFTRMDPKIGRYKTYCNEIDRIAGICGYTVKHEYLRIPSTKNLCIVGSRNGTIDQTALELLLDGVKFMARIADRDKVKKDSGKHVS